MKKQKTDWVLRVMIFPLMLATGGMALVGICAMCDPIVSTAAKISISLFSAFGVGATLYGIKTVWVKK